VLPAAIDVVKRIHAASHVRELMHIILWPEEYRILEKALSSTD
jgi:hypothetical protein